MNLVQIFRSVCMTALMVIGLLGTIAHGGI